MSLDHTWVSEPFLASGSAIAFRITKKLHEEQTPFQKIEIYQSTDWGNIMLIDGCMMLTTRDNFLYHEMISHMALFSHKNPKNIVIIGGGDCGTLREVLKHHTVKTAVQCDIDERVTRLAEQYFPELCTANNDTRATLMFDDGVRYMAELPAESIDLVIIDSTDPVGPAEGLFGAKFYASCFQALRADGLLVQQSESPLIHMQLIGDMHKYLRQAGFQDSQTFSFPQPCYPTGWWSGTMACKQNQLSYARQQDAVQKPFATKYYNAEIHQAALTMPEFMRQQLLN